VPYFFLRQRRSEFRAFPHLVAPVLVVALFAVVLAAQFFTAAAVGNYPGLQPQYLGAVIVGGWLALGIAWLAGLRLWRPNALEAGEHLYVETT
jgi:hypothetical protein